MPADTAPQNLYFGAVTHTDTHRHTQTHTDTHTHRHTQTQTHTHTDTYTHRHTQTHTHRHRHTHRHTQTHTYTRRHTQTHTQTHRHRHTQTHTDTHTLHGSSVLPDTRPQAPRTSHVAPRVAGLIPGRDPPMPSVRGAGVVKRRERSQPRLGTRSSLCFCFLLWDPPGQVAGALRSRFLLSSLEVMLPTSQVRGECPLRCLQTVKCCADRSWAVRKSCAACF